jgi:hypothetical protein
MKPQQEEQVRHHLKHALARGYTRREACRAAGLHHATLYRWLHTRPGFREWFCQMEARYAEDRKVHRWYTHPFRGRRPPRPEGARTGFPGPRFEISGYQKGCAIVARR